MKLCRTEDLKENDVIGKTVMTRDYQILLSEGVVLKKSYIEKLKEMRIEEVYIKSKISDNIEEVKIIKKETEDKFHDKVKRILEQHTYRNNKELEDLSKAADIIINSILQEEEVMKQVFDIRERNADIYDHSVSVCAMATLTSLKMKMSIEEVHDIGVSSILHDLGHRYITALYENRELSEMSENDRVQYKKHSIYGYTALKDEDWLSEESKKYILYHHENLDGSGFPLGVDKITMQCSILSVCDTFDEMICGIGHRRSKVYEAIEYLKTFRGILYYKKAVDVFLQFIAVFPVGTKVMMSNGSLAVVLRQNSGFPERPVVSMVSGNGIGTETKDLLKCKTLNIEKVIV